MEEYKVPILTRIYMAAFVILLMSIAILSISLAFIALETKQEVTKIRLILQDDYDVIYETETAQQQDR